jgi:hypothetical protein
VKGEPSRTAHNKLCAIPSLPVKGESSRTATYKIHFGRNQGKTFSDVLIEYVIRLEKLIDLPNFKQATPELRAALREFRVMLDKIDDRIIESDYDPDTKAFWLEMTRPVVLPSSTKSNT